MVTSIDFKIVPPKEANVSVMDRSFLYGDSIYEVVRTYGRSMPFLLKEHYQRLEKSADSLSIPLNFDLEQLEKHILECLKKFDQPNAYVRIVVSRGENAVLSLSTQTASRSKTVIIVCPVQSFPPHWSSGGIKLFLTSVKRNDIKSLPPSIKSGNYLNNILALKEAQTNGEDDALITNLQNEITELTTSNIFFVKGQSFVTPSLDSGILSGITRNFLIKALQENQCLVEERKVKLDELNHFEECFATSTLKDVTFVDYVLDGQKKYSFTDKTLTKKAQDIFTKSKESILSQRPFF